MKKNVFIWHSVWRFSISRIDIYSKDRRACSAAFSLFLIYLFQGIELSLENAVNPNITRWIKVHKNITRRSTPDSSHFSSHHPHSHHRHGTKNGTNRGDTSSTGIDSCDDLLYNIIDHEVPPLLSCVMIWNITPSILQLTVAELCHDLVYHLTAPMPAVIFL